MVLTAGCWGKKEINNLAMVVASGVDLVDGEDKEQKVRVTLQIANPVTFIPGQGGGTQGPGQPKAFWTVAGTGASIRTAEIQVTHFVPRELFFGHNHVLVIGENAARQGVVPYLDRFIREQETRQSIYLVVARGKAKDVLELEMPTFRATSIAIKNLLDLKSGTQDITAVTLSQFAYAVNTGTTGPVAPVVTIIPQTSVSVEDLKTPGALAKTMKLSGLAVFNPQGKLLGFFNTRETMGTMWVRDWVKERELTVFCPVEGPPEPIGMKIVEAKSSTVVRMESGGRPAFTINVRTICDLSEHFGAHPGLLDIWYFESLERRVSTLIKNEILASLRKAQSLNTDVLALGEQVRQQQRYDWQQLEGQWAEIFPTVKVTVNVETAFRHRGLAVEPVGLKEGD